jgi:tetratricopeptide (TPR) repeat protein
MIMKKTVFLFGFVLTVQLGTLAGNNPYIENMKQAKIMTDSASTVKTLITAAALFERIAGVNPDQWLPHYYAAYCYTRICHLCTDEKQKDAWVDRAQAEIDKAFALEPAQAEVLMMKGFVLQARMSINPMIRGMQYNQETMEYFDKASELDPEDPRPYLWKGVNLLHMPAAFGGGKERALPLIEKALAKYATFVPADSLAPDWGLSYAQEMMKACQ